MALKSKTPASTGLTFKTRGKNDKKKVLIIDKRKHIGGNMETMGLESPHMQSNTAKTTD